MALGLRHWIVLTLAGLALVAATLLPLGPEQRGGKATVSGLDRTPAEAEYHALSRELRSLHAVVDRRRWSDSLAALAVAAADRGEIAVGGPAEAVEAETIERLAARARGELASLGPLREDVALGFFLVPRQSEEAESSVARDHRVGSELYIGQRDGRTYCMNLLVAPRGRMGGRGADYTPWLGSSAAIGACHLVARFGHPGPEILAWLEGGAASYGALPPGHTGGGFPLRFGGDMMYFGIRMVRLNRSLAYDRCHVGDAEGCQAVFLRPEIGAPSFEYLAVSRSDLVQSSFDHATFLFGLIDRYMLADLAEEFGPERFERFWTSDAPVAEAFETAFGTTAGEWILQWIGKDELRPAGPAVQEAHLPATMLFVVLAGAVAAWWTRRWQVI